MTGKSPRHFSFASAVIVLWGACAFGDAPEGERDLDAVVAEILAGPDDTGYGEPKRCIVSGRIDRTQVLSDRMVVFHMRGGEKYVVQFKRRCPGTAAQRRHSRGAPLNANLRERHDSGTLRHGLRRFLGGRGA